MTTRFAALLLIGSVALTSCSDSKTVTCAEGTLLVNGVCELIVAATVDCGEGTVEQGGECVPENSLACGPGTFEQAGVCVPVEGDDTMAPTTTPDPFGGEVADASTVTLTTDEPALIYFTTDGSDPGPGSRAAFSPAMVTLDALDEGNVTLRYYGVDAAGNEEAIKDTVFLPYSPFTPVTNFKVSLTTDDATIIWTEPPGATGVLVAKVAGPLSGGPVHGQMYTAGQTLPGGHEVVFSGNAASIDQMDLTPGLAHYAAWAYTTEKYSRPRVDMEIVPLPAQTGSASVDVMNNTVMVTSPSHVTVTGTSSFSAPNLTVTLSLTNNTTRALYNPKVVFTNPNIGAVTNADGVLIGNPYVIVDVALLPGDTLTRDVVFASVSGTDTVTFDIELHDDPMLLSPSAWVKGSYGTRTTGIVDTATEAFAGKNQEGALFRTFAKGPGGGFMYTTAALALDGQHLYVGYRQSPTITLLDVARQTEVGSVTLSSERGMTRYILIDHERDLLYVALTVGRHAYDNNFNVAMPPTQIFLIKLDASSLKELARVELAPIDPNGNHVMSRTLALSPDGQTIAVGIVNPGDEGSLHIVETTTMTEEDINGAAAGNGLDIGTSDTLFPASLIFSVDGEKLYVGNASPTPALGVVDLTNSYTITTHNLGTMGRVNKMRWGAGGLLFLGGATSSSGLHTFDPTDDTFVEFGSETAEANRFVFDAAGDIYVSADSNTTRKLDVTGDVVSTFTGSDGEKGEWLIITPY